MTRTINEYEVRNALADAVLERGYSYLYQENFSVSACKYVVDGEPACIVGVALISYLGIEWPRARYDTSLAANGTIAYLLDELRDAGIEFTPAALLMLTAAQAVQDGGGTWGLAESVALSVMSALSVLDEAKGGLK